MILSGAISRAPYNCALLRDFNRRNLFVLGDSCQFTLSGDFACIVISSGANSRALCDLVSLRAVGNVTQFVPDEGFYHPQGRCNIRQSR